MNNPFRKCAVMAWHDALPRAEDEHRFSCVLGCGGKKQVRHGMEWSATERNNGLLLLCGAGSL